MSSLHCVIVKPKLGTTFCYMQLQRFFCRDVKLGQMLEAEVYRPDAKENEITWVPQTNETISAASGPNFTILWGQVEEILLLNKFFPIVDICLSCEDIARQSCGMVPRWRFLATFWVLHLQRAACSTFQTCILNSH